MPSVRLRQWERILKYNSAQLCVHRLKIRPKLAISHFKTRSKFNLQFKRLELKGSSCFHGLRTNLRFMAETTHMKDLLDRHAHCVTSECNTNK